MNKIKLTIATFSLILVGCSDDDSPAGNSGTFTEGTYNMTSATEYETADCSGAGISGECMTDATAMTEATCPSGLCAVGFDFVTAADQAACNTADGAWMTGICGDGSSNQSACVAACYDDTGVIEALDEDACDATDAEWLGWTNFGWISYAEDSDWSLTFGANGVFTDSDSEGGTYTVDGTTITVVIPACCSDYDTGDCTDATTTEAACTDGEWEEEETQTGTLDTAAGTISIEMSNPGECYGFDGEDEAATEPADETACNAAYGHWESGCYSIIFTLSTD